MKLAGKAVLLTGAAGAIGGATATRLASEGARLVLADREGTSLAAVAAGIVAAGGKAEVAFFDAASAASSSRLVDIAVERLGSLDAVCNVAGVYTKAAFTDITNEDWDRVLRINLSSVFAICRQAMPHLVKSGGAIANTASLAALRGLPYSAHYAVSKAGIIALTQSLAAEFAAAGVRVNAVSPGGIRSAMSAIPAVPGADPELGFRMSRLKGFGGRGEPRDVAAAFAYLLSDDARYVSGAVLTVDGAQFLI